MLASVAVEEACRRAVPYKSLLVNNEQYEWDSLIFHILAVDNPTCLGLWLAIEGLEC
jgi:hypothetical protein